MDEQQAEQIEQVELFDSYNEPYEPDENALNGTTGNPPDNEQASHSEEDELSGRVQTSSTCHNLTCYSEPADTNAETDDDPNNENSRLFKNKSESDLVVNKNRLSKIYLPAEDTMDLEQSFKQQTAKKYSSSWFFGDASKKVYPTIEDQVKLCRKIASQLVDDENRKSKGASMFFKRVKRAAKWVHEGEGTRKEAQCNGSSSSSSLAADEEVEKLKRNLKLDVNLPNLKLILDPRELLSLEKLKKTGDIVEHNIVSPDVCHSLIKELEDSPNSPEINKGAAIFLKRKEKSRDWIVDENSAVVQAREQKREQELRKAAEENVQKEWLMKRQKESAVDFDSGQQKPVLYIQAKQPLKPANRQALDAVLNLGNLTNKTDNCSNVSPVTQSVKHNVQSNQFLKLNFKNFNRNARGWGVATDEHEKQLEKLQETPEYRPSIALPSGQAITQRSSFGGPSISQPSGQFSQFTSPFSSQPIINRQPPPALQAVSTPSSSYTRPASNYPAIPAKAAPVDERNPQKRHIVTNPPPPPPPSNYTNASRSTIPLHRPVVGKRDELKGQQIAYSNSTALLNAVQHQANLANFNSFLFDKQQSNKRFAVRNDAGPQPVYSGAQYLNGGLYNGLSNGGAPHYEASSIRPSFDLTKMQIPHSRLPKFKDFNNKPKMFIRGCS